MRLRRRRAALGMFALVFVAMATVLAAAQNTQKKPEPPVFGAGVTLVAVPVFVTDKSGKSVRGLTAADFEVEDQGEPVPIAAFQAIDVDVPSAPGAPGAEMVPTLADLPLAVQAAAPRQFIILVDRVFSPPGGLFFGRKAAGEFIRGVLAPGDLVAVAAWGSNGLKVLTNFTTDHDAAARAIDGKGLAGATAADPLGLSGGFGLGGGSGIPGADPVGTGGIPATGSAGDVVDAELAAQDGLMKEADEAAYRLAATAFIEDLSTLVRLVAPLRGRKQIVLLSSGFAEWAWVTPPNIAAKAEGEPLEARLKRVFKAAGQADVVIHTITLDAIDAAMDVGEVKTRGIDATGPLDFSKGPSAARAVLNRNSGRATLATLSENTGGRFILPTGNFGRALGEVEQISRHSYVIAFETPEKGGKSDHPRRLKVRVKRPGLSVSHRPEYITSPRPATSGAAQMLAAEAISKGLSGGPLRLHLSTLPYRDNEGTTNVQAVLHLDGTALAEASHEKALSIQVYGYAMADGRVVDGLALNTAIDSAKFGPMVRDSGITVLTAFPVATGNLDLRFYVRAGSADLTGSIQRDVAVPAFVAGERALSAPMFMLPPAGRLVVPFQPKSRPAIAIPFYVGDRRFVPDAAVVLTPSRARDACVFVWRERADGAAPFDVTAELIRAGQAPQSVRIDGAPRVVSEADGFDRYVVTLVTPAVAAGAYRLRLTFLDPRTGRSFRSEAEVDLEG